MSVLEQIEEMRQAWREKRLTLSQWDKGFLKDIQLRIKRGEALTQKQLAVVNKIYSRIVLPSDR